LVNILKSKKHEKAICSADAFSIHIINISRGGITCYQTGYHQETQDEERYFMENEEGYHQEAEISFFLNKKPGSRAGFFV
jgi:hypothetical protein